jgi:hypothetical protein
VLVDSYGSPTAAEDAAFFAQTFGGPAPDVDAVFPLGKTRLQARDRQRQRHVRTDVGCGLGG